MVPEEPLFISYTRRDYYFAESLAHHLIKRGVAVWLDVRDLNPGVFWERDLEEAVDRSSCVVLIVSPESMKTVNVEREWRRALKQGKRIVVAHFRMVHLPEELSACEVVDFRGAFGPALDHLISRLQASPGAAAPTRRRILPRIPPWILALLFTLAVPSAGYFALANWRPDPQGSSLLNAVVLVLLPVLVLLLVWFLCFSFLRRGMGMTRLTTILATLSGVYAYPLVLSRLASPAGLAGYAPSFAEQVVHHWYSIALLGAVPLAGLGIVLLVQPEDLLRWTPTGTAWDWYRARRAGEVKAPGARSTFGKVRTFRLLHDATDAPAAERLRRELREMGAQERETPDDRDTAVVLLTERTRTTWLAGWVDRLPADVLTVVGTRIRLPDEFGWLWRRQWIDFRHWDLRRLEGQRLPQVPEALTRVRVPGSVRLVHHLLCALMALLVISAGLANPEGASPPGGSSENQAASFVETAAVLGAWVMLALLARRLLRRRIHEASFLRGWFIALGVGSVVILWDLWRAVAGGLAWFYVVLGAAFLVAMGLVFLKMRPRLAFWFPAPDAVRTKDETLTAGRNWQTLIWTCVYLLAWGLVFRIH